MGDGLPQVRPLIEENRAQLERQLGGPFLFGSPGPEDGMWVIRVAGAVGRLHHDPASQALIAEGPDSDSVFDAISLLPDLWKAPGETLVVEDCQTPAEAAARIEASTAVSWPSFELRGIDWRARCEHWIPRVIGAEDPVGAMKRWVATLDDGHTAVRPVETPGRLPYRAEMQGSDIILIEVPADTAGYEAGARPGDALLGVDVERLAVEQAGRPHSHALLVGLSSLRGPAGDSRELRTNSGACWVEEYALAPWPDPLEVSRLDDGRGYIRLRAWMPALEDDLHSAIDEMSDLPGLVFDLRGNGGGNYLMATRARGRFLDRSRQVGWIRYRHPAGALTELEPITAETSERPTWDKPLTVLIDPETYSASEDFLMGLGEQRNVRLLGEASGGGSGRLRSVRLLPGWQLTITTCHTFTNGRQIIEGVGHQVDGPLP